MIMTPRDTTIKTATIGSQTSLSQYDIQSLNKAYSCTGRVPTYGGGFSQVLHKNTINKEIAYLLLIYKKVKNNFLFLI
jgi:hypothetical protein